MSSILGNWITNGGNKPFYARREFVIAKQVKRAQAKVCGLGQFIFYLNGRKVEDHELDPGWTNYHKWIEYVSFDVTEYLQMGENALGVEVGNGWFLKIDEGYTFSFPEFMPPNPNPYHAFSDQLVLGLLLTIEYADGSVEMIQADENFRVCQNATISSNVYGSELMDGRLVQKGWNETGFNDLNWDSAAVLPKRLEPAGKLREQFQPAIKVIKRYPAVFLHKVGDREIYDFGQNMSGMLEFWVRGKRGDVIKVYPAEKLSADGDADQVAKNWVTVDSCMTYIIGEDDSWEMFRMKFTYFAGRYVGVEKSSERIELKNLCADAITSAWKDNGNFICDDERYNQIYDMIKKTVEANMVSVHTDCPTIERFAWQEPNHLMAPSIMYMKDGSTLWEKFLLDMRMEQHTGEDYFFDYEGNKIYPGDGLMPSQCPCYIPNVIPVPGMGSFYDIIPWGSTCILGTKWHYMFYGKKEIIEQNYEAGKRYFKYLKTKVTEEGFINHGLGDWGNPKEELARENVETAFLYADAKTLAWFAEILGKVNEKKEFEDYAERVKENYNRRLMTQNQDKRWCYYSYEHSNALVLTQTIQAIPLCFGMVPKEREEDVVAVFEELLRKEGALTAGEIGLPYIIQTARKYGMNDLISSFILREEHPSYYAFVLDGETTLGEYWEKNPRSHCHDMMGHIVEWYYNGIAGIEILEPGFKKVRIRPYMPKSVNEFTCTHETPYGVIRVSGTRVAGEESFEISVPEGIELI